MSLLLSAVFVWQSPATCSTCYVPVWPGGWGCLCPRYCRLWHRYLPGTNICTQIWLQSGQQPGSVIKDGSITSDVFRCWL